MHDPESVEVQALAEQLIPHILGLGSAIFEFAQTNRATWLNREGVPESDTDHTVMLGIMACGLAQKYLPDLDVGLLAQMALVHDFPEPFAGGDTSTAMIDQQGLYEKEKREAAGKVEIKNRFGRVFPWIHTTIDKYDDRDTPEAEFLSLVDKWLTSIPHLLTDCASLRALDIHTPEAVDLSVAITTARIESFAHRYPLALAIRHTLIEMIKAKLAEQNAAAEPSL